MQVRAGTYTAMNNINGAGFCSVQAPNDAVIGGAPGAPITIRPYDGNFTAHFTAGIRLVRCKYLTLTGLDISFPSGVQTAHPLSVISGCAGSPAGRLLHSG